MLFLLQKSTILTVGLESMRENYAAALVWVLGWVLD
jgi:hypothetical protein